MGVLNKYSFRVFIVILSLVLCVFGKSASAFQGLEGEVQLSCKIKPAFKDHMVKSWLIELRKSSGEQVEQDLVMTGSKVSFRSLKPGIYFVCMSGTMAQEHCESVDLTPPSGKSFHRFEKEIKEPMPAINGSNFHTVRTTELVVPREAQMELERAQRAVSKGDQEQAIKHLELALSIYPRYTAALNNLGTLYHHSRKYKQAIQCFTNVIEIQPESYVGWINLGGSLISNGEFRKALEANERAYQIQPDDAHVVSQLGLNYFYLRDYPKAEQFLKRTIELDPYSPIYPQIYLAHIALASNQLSEARAYMQEFVDLHPNAPEAAGLRKKLEHMQSDDIEHEAAEIAARR